MSDALAILERIALEYVKDDMWTDSRFGFINGFSSTVIGTIGESFGHEMCCETGLSGEFPGRRLSWDIRINGRTFEIKTATHGSGGTFQFNNIRIYEPYDALLVIGIMPNDALMQAWTKRRVGLGMEGRLAPMAKHVDALCKLTKRKPDLLPVDRFEEVVGGVLRELDIGTATDPGPEPTPGSPGMLL